MIDLSIYVFLSYTYVFIAILFLVKIVLFLKHRNKNWTITQFIFFTETNIKFTTNSERSKLKKTQNFLSAVILFLLVIQILSVLLF
jgi:hypothetical protein